MMYVIGIDLGTTNIVVSYAQNAENADVEIFDIPQLIAPGQIKALPMLPALRYHYTDELAQEQCQLPWKMDSVNAKLPNAIIGQYAAELGNKNPERLVVSAKSWLSHCADQNAQIGLPDPGNNQPLIDTVTPLEATSSYLSYIKAAWDHQFPTTPFSEQMVVVTVPASFDDIARALTIEAVKRVGIKEFKLLEEPQAACYHWLAENPHEQLAQAQHLMVCDIGGGTTDFTLIRIAAKTDKRVKFERIGVGDHLMLGGDNMDLTLAARSLNKLELEPTQKLLNKLVNQCRQAKETLLGDSPPDELPIQYQTAGSQLFGNIKSTRLTQKEVQQALLDGFFPEVAISAKPKKRSKALSSFTLPYPDDAGITRHIAQFLSDHQTLLGEAQETIVPDVWLLNGGPFLSSQVRERLRDVIDAWSTESVTWLHNADPQSAVALGACHYGLAKQQDTALIESKVARNYFIKAQSETGFQAICVLPKFSEVHEPLKLEREFSLKQGQPVQFEVGYTNDEQSYKVGDKVNWHEKIHQLPALTTEIEGTGTTKVQLMSELDELGVLNVNMQDTNSSQNWHLHFNLRNESQSNTPAEETHPKLDAAIKLIEAWFGAAKDNKKNQPLRKALESLLGAKESWSGSLARQLFDALLARSNRRRRSASHERTWLNVAGFCLRPGIGLPGDTQRIEAIWSMYAQGIQHHQQLDIWAQWWTFWRRASAGLSQDQQLVLYTDCQSVLNSKLRKQAGKPKATAAPEEKLKLLGSLERLPLNIKEQILDSVSKQLFDSKLSRDMIWCAARLVNCHALYTGEEYLLQNQLTEDFIDELALLTGSQADAVKMILDASNPDTQNNDALWGDVLPTGLVLD